MKKFIKQNALVLSALFIVIIAIIIIIATGKPVTSYSMPAGDVVTHLQDTGSVISPVVLFGQLEKNEKGIVLVDIRNNDDYSRGHIANAINIPVPLLLEKSSVAFLRKVEKSGQMMVLYGNDQSQANAPWLFLLQTGIGHARVLQGGYEAYSKLPVADSLTATFNHSLFAEKSIIDTAAFQAGKTALPSQKAESGNEKKEKVTPVKHKTTSGGGC